MARLAFVLVFLLMPAALVSGDSVDLRLAVRLADQSVWLDLSEDSPAAATAVGLPMLETQPSACGQAYTGSVMGVPHSAARVSLRDGRLLGLLLAPGGPWILTGTPDRPMATSALGMPPGPTIDRVEADDDSSAILPPAAGEGTMVLRLAFEADHAMFHAHPDDWMCVLGDITAAVEAMYQQHFDIRFELTWLGAWTEPDPYDSPNVCTHADGYRLKQFQQYWLQHRAGVERDLAHLAMGTAGDGSTVGCGFIAGLATAAGFGVSQVEYINETDEARKAYEFLTAVITVAHEIGHNFGGLHERSIGAYGAACSPLAAFVLAPSTIMAPQLNPAADRFSNLERVPSCFSSGPPRPHFDYEMDNVSPMERLGRARLGIS